MIPEDSDCGHQLGRVSSLLRSLRHVQKIRSVFCRNVKCEHLLCKLCSCSWSSLCLLSYMTSAWTASSDILKGLGCNRWLLYVLQNILMDKHIQTSTNRSTECCVNVSERKRNDDVCWCEVYMTNRRFILEVLKLKTKQTVETSEQLNRLRRTFSFIVSFIRLNPPTVQQNTNK